MCPKGSFVLAVVSPVAAMLVIDSSGPMRDNDPRGARGERIVPFLASLDGAIVMTAVRFACPFVVLHTRRFAFSLGCADAEPYSGRWSLSGSR